jgi:hypothetical protein
MTKQLVFVHGRSQEHKDSIRLKAEWVQAWSAGLAKSGLTLPLDDSNIRFPYYGQALFDLASGTSDDAIAKIVVRGDAEDLEQLEFLRSALADVLEQAGVSDAQILELADEDIAERGVLNLPFVQAMLRAIDRYVPKGSGISIALATNDVYQYLTNPGIKKVIETGVRQAITPRVPCVVVSHSLGTVVSYNLLRGQGEKLGWDVPLFVTLGSPLGVTAIKETMRPLRAATCVGQWFNAMDKRDVVALYPLNEKNFNIDPAIQNKVDVDNHTENRHGIAGYLDDKEVARRIYDALLAL